MFQWGKEKIYIYIYICVCVCVCACSCNQAKNVIGWFLFEKYTKILLENKTISNPMNDNFEEFVFVINVILISVFFSFLNRSIILNHC